MINFKSVTLRRGTKVLLDQATAGINPGEKAGLVGRNGAGKSSLFALIDGHLHEDGGEFSRPPGWRLAQVAQEMPETAQGATDFVIAGDARLMAAKEEAAAAEAANNGERMACAYMAMHDAGAHDAHARAQTLMLGLGFKLTELDKPVNSFSGGWRMRLQLARALMCPSDLLLLDEPTNHLDLDALVWLESWLKRYAGTLIVISHDREFLDAVTRVTLYIEDGKLTRYGGNYSAFEETRAQQLELQQSAYLRQQEKIARLKKFIDRFRAKATKARQAQSRVKALERMEKLAPVLTGADFTFEFKEPLSLPNPMLLMRDVDCGYPPPEAVPGVVPAVIVRKVTCAVSAGQRIGILGANGQGKSTLIKTVARVLTPLGGALTESKGLSIGYFAQRELDVLRPQDTPFEHLARLAGSGQYKGEGGPEREQDLRNFLGSFNFSGDMAARPVGLLSGGEKARLALAMIVWQRPNLLLLDEPTNHLDLATREALAVALNEFEGSVMLVSHDRALLRSVCDEFWLVTRGGVESFDGDLDDYQQFLLDEARCVLEAQKTGLREEKRKKTALSSSSASPAAKRKAAAPLKTLKRELGKIEQRMTELEARRSVIEARLGESLPPREIGELGRELQALNDALAENEEEWLRLCERIEAVY